MAHHTQTKTQYPRYSQYSMSCRVAERGLTLLEVMVALVILAVGLLALASMQVSSIQANTSGFASTAAVSVADQRVQQLKDLAFSDASLTAGTHTVGTATTGGTNILYYLSYSVTDSAPIAGVKLIAYTVAWSGNRAVTNCSLSPLPANCHAVSLLTRKCDESLQEKCRLQ